MVYSVELRKLGLTAEQSATILSGWDCESIESLIRGDIPLSRAPSIEGIANEISQLKSLD